MDPKDLIANFAQLQNAEPCIFILRHAEKYITDMSEDILQTITPGGKTKAKLLGRNLKEVLPKVCMVKSSPVERCLQTASAIFPLHYENIEIIHSTVLGADGVYVSDNKLAMQNFLECSSPESVFFRMLDGEALPGMRSKEEGTKLLLTSLLQDLEELDGPGFYVTHDCILVLFVGTLIDRPITIDNWFQYLDSICIKRSDDRIDLYWGDEVFDITAKVNELLNITARKTLTL
jgi:hypothetical protein